MNRQKRKGLFTFITFLLVVAVGIGTLLNGNRKVEILNEKVPLASCVGNFVRANGTKMMDQHGNEFLIRAMGFGNACWSNHDGPTYSDHTEDDYANLNELGFNTVRYYLNYGIFEDDATPYKYKQEAWDWIDQNVEWARKHNIKIIFNMHYPQGGFQSAGNGMDLWFNNHDEQNRLASLWKAIAERYADEEAVLGYGLVNEPYMPWLGNESATIAQWQNLAQKLTDTIREVDTNHTIFVEAAFAAKDTTTNQIYQRLNDKKNLIWIDDPCNNVVQEVHYYNPSEFTHMSSEAAVSYLDYPNDNIAITSGEQWIESTYNEVIALDYTSSENTSELSVNEQNEDRWKKVETVLYTVTNPEANVFYLSLATNSLNGGTVYYDDASIDLYDPDGNYVCNVLTFDFSTDNQWYNYFSADGTGSAFYLDSEGYSGNGCIGITGANSFACVGMNVPVCVNVKSGYQYKLSVWNKAEETSEDTIIYPQFALCKGVEARPYTEEYLIHMLGEYQSVANEWNMPLFLGEFGVLEETYNGHGGEQWIKDMINACAKQEVGFSQHLYHSEGFGLYTNSQYLLPADENVSLKNAILESVKPLQINDATELWEYEVVLEEAKDESDMKEESTTSQTEETEEATIPEPETEDIISESSGSGATESIESTEPESTEAIATEALESTTTQTSAAIESESSAAVESTTAEAVNNSEAETEESSKTETKSNSFFARLKKWFSW